MLSQQLEGLQMQIEAIIFDHNYSANSKLWTRLMAMEGRLNPPESFKAAALLETSLNFLGCPSESLVAIRQIIVSFSTLTYTIHSQQNCKVYMTPSGGGQFHAAAASTL